MQKLQSIASVLIESLYLQKENLFLWLPVFFACGIAIYFSLSFEPPLILSIFAWGFVLAIYLLVRPIKDKSISGYIIVSFMFLAVLIMSGFLAANARTNIIATPVIEKKLAPVNVTGKIISIEKMEEGAGIRLVLSDLDIEKLAPDKIPRKIRLRLRADNGDVKIGQRIKVLAALNAPSAPIIPDGFDFRRYLYFQGIGAVGFIYNAPEIIEDIDSGGMGVESLRHYIAKQITDNLTPEQASVALALVVGHKNALSGEDKQVLRDAGLAHMLAISGLHVGFVAGALFFFSRLFLSCFTNFALRYSIKNIAAVIAFGGAVFYMVLAGSTVPTQRAVLMIGIVFLAIIIDRSPISLRLVAFAALVVLIIAPESLLSASFHMSFAAVICLIYFYEITRKYWMKYNAQSGWYHKVLLYFIGVCMTTVIASIATAPFALYHFGQVSYLGSLANFVAVPLLAFMILPFALLSLIFMIFGIEYYSLQIVGLGIDYMLDIAYWAASLPNAIVRISAWEFGSFAMFVLSALFMILWKGWGKVLALPFMAWSVISAQNYVYPDILVASSHKLFAFKLENGDLYVSTRRSERFVRENWEKYYGLEVKSSKLLPYKGGERDISDFYSCGEFGCRFEIKGRKISFIRHFYIQKQECSWADIIISTPPMKIDCNAGIVIDKFDSWKNGAYAVWINDDGIKIQNVAQKTSNRPWSIYSFYNDSK